MLLAASRALVSQAGVVIVAAIEFGKVVLYAQRRKDVRFWPKAEAARHSKPSTLPTYPRC
jgi:hypothetical protein